MTAETPSIEAEKADVEDGELNDAEMADILPKDSSTVADKQDEATRKPQEDPSIRTNGTSCQHIQIIDSTANGKAIGIQANLKRHKHVNSSQRNIKHHGKHLSETKGLTHPAQPRIDLILMAPNGGASSRPPHNLPDRPEPPARSLRSRYQERPDTRARPQPEQGRLRKTG